MSEHDMKHTDRSEELEAGDTPELVKKLRAGVAISSMVARPGGGHSVEHDFNGTEATMSEAADRIVELEAENERLREALRFAIINCACSITERDSGHRVDCWVPDVERTIEQALNQSGGVAASEPTAERKPSDSQKGLPPRDAFT